MNIDARIVWEDAIANSIGATGSAVSLPPSYIPGDRTNIEKRRKDGRRKEVRNLVNRILSNRQKREEQVMKKYSQFREFFDGLDSYEIDIEGLGTIRVPVNGPAKLVKSSGKKKPGELELRPYRAIKPEASPVQVDGMAQVKKEARQKNVVEESEYIEESGGKVIDQLKKIANSGQAGVVTFENGEKKQMSPASASKVVKLYKNLNPSNRVKMIKSVNSSPAGLGKISSFADSRGE